MPKSKPTPAPYRAHRQRQRRRILDAARALFDASGIDRVTMAEITATSGLQPSTLYQYFPNKDEIVAALVSELFAHDHPLAQQRMDQARDSLDRIAALFNFLAEDLARNPANARFMAQFDALYARDWPVEKLLAIEARSGLRSFHFLARLIRQGIADGSLRGDLQPSLTLHAVLNAVVGLERRLASLGSKVEQEFAQPVDRLFREALRILLLGLASPRAARRFRSQPAKSIKPPSSLPKKAVRAKQQPSATRPANQPRKPRSQSRAQSRAQSRTTGETR